MNFNDIEHQLEALPPQEKLAFLTNADSLFGFSALEKAYLMKVFEGKNDAQIAGELHIPLSTSKWMRNEFLSKMRQARGMLMIESILDGKMSRREYRRPARKADELPFFDDKYIIRGFCREKRQLHDAGLFHATVIIIVAKRLPETGEMMILVSDKADQLPASGKDTAVRHAYDLIGGHIKRIDAPMEIGDPFPFERAMESAARRELSAELVLRKSKHDPDRLDRLYVDRHQGPLGGGTNHELSWVYLYPVLPSDTVFHTPGGVRIRDDWIDSIGEKVIRYYPGRFYSVPEIAAEIDKNPSDANDALTRVLEHMKMDNDLLQNGYERFVRRRSR